MTRHELELLLKIRAEGEQSFQKVSSGVGTLTREAQAATPAVEGMRAATARADQAAASMASTVTNKLSPGVDALQGKLTDQKQRLDALASTLKRQADAQRKQSDEVQKANTGFAALTKTVGAYVSGAALGLAIKQTIGYADSLKDLSATTQISVTSLQKLDRIARTNGGSLGEVTNAAQQMADRLGSGDRSAVTALHRLGLEFDAVRQMRPDEALVTVAKAAAEIRDPMEKASIYTDLLGRSGRNLIGTMDAIAAQFDETNALISSETVDNLAELQDTWEGLKLVGLGFIANVLGPIVALLRDMKTLAGGAFDALPDWVKRLMVQSAAASPMGRQANAAATAGWAFDMLTPVELPEAAGSQASAVWNRDIASVMRQGGLLVGHGALDPVVAVREMDAADRAAAQRLAQAVKESAREAEQVAKAMKAAWQEWYEGVLLGRRTVLEAQKTVAAGPQSAFGATGLGAVALTLPRLTPEGWNLAPLNARTESWDDIRARMTPTYGQRISELLAMGTMNGPAPMPTGLSPDEVAAIRARGPAFSWLGFGGSLATAGLGAAMGGGNLMESMGFTASQSLVDWFSQQSGLTGLAQGVGGLAAGLGGFMTGRGVTQQTGSRLLGGLAGAGTGALSGFAAGGPIGAVVGGLAGAVGSLFGPSKGAIEGKQADADIKALQENLLSTYGSLGKISELGKLVGVDLAGAWGDKNKAGLAHFTGMMREFEDRVRGLEEATEKYGLTWRELGPQVQAQKVKEVSQGLLDDYENMTRAGIDNEVAVRRMAPALNELIAKAVESGQTVPDALVPILETLQDMGLMTHENALALAGLSDGVTVDFRKMADVAAEYGIELGALGEKFQAARISDAARQILEDFAFLKDSGADVNGVLDGMADEISALVQDSQKFGVAIPENMRPLIEQLIESGRLLDENGEKITDLGELEFAEPVTAGFDKIVDAIKVDLVGAIQDLGRIFRGDLVDDAKAGADGIRDAFAGVRITVPVEYDYEVAGEPRPGSANGILATYPRLRWFGEREPELGGSVDFMSKALAGALQQTGGIATGGLGGPMVVQVALDKRVLGEVTVDIVPEILRRRGLL